MKARFIGLVGVALATLVACGDQEVILNGERLDVTGNEPAVAINRAAPLSLPTPSVNANWTHKNGNTAHFLAHPALQRSLQPVWSTPIGEGNERKHRITADPVVASGRIYTMDSRSLVAAHTASGGTVWTRDITPATENKDDASSGGLAVAGDTLYVTSGFGFVTALNAATGAPRWTQSLDAAPMGAPTVQDGVVFLTTRDSLGWALDASTGRILWQVFGATSDSGISGGSAPAIAGPLVVFPFPSGQMVSAVRGTGQQAWAASVAGKRLGRAFSKFTDLSGDPVVAGNVVYAGNHAGSAAAFDATTGQSLWRADEGALSPVWIAGGSVFLISDENRLVRLDAATGETIWARDLPFFTRERIKRRKGTFAHYGPVLAGGRLLVASDTGALREFDPVNGNLIGSTELPSGAARNPVVAGGTLYLVTENGTLHAFR
ncbi:MAG: PQQ-binding-like beta-propeller repeat protein [Silicimonas sp.]|nr:PQQ-binding-like beta-propeller repeat protein [Silicimonas sp.]